jgi:hypothetical protein
MTTIVGDFLTKYTKVGSDLSRWPAVVSDVIINWQTVYQVDNWMVLPYRAWIIDIRG